MIERQAGMAVRWTVAALIGVLVVCAPARASDNDAAQLQKLAKQAHERGLLDQAAALMCKAAQIEPRKYSKGCDRARQDEANQVAAFEALFATAKFELQQNDPAGAVRDLSLIVFGPRHQEAQQLIQWVRVAAHSGEDGQRLQAAQAAYQSGNFDAAVKSAAQVHAAALIGAAQQILANVRVYQDSIEQGEALEQSGNFEGARQKYLFALTIKSNGPGDPATRFHNVEAALARQQQARAAQASSTPAAAPALSQKIDVPAQVRSGLLDERRAEKRGDLKAAMKAIEGVLALDGGQAAALAAKRRVQAEMVKSERADGPRGTLESGIRSFYASDFEQAETQLTLFLGNGSVGGSVHHQEAAQFYLAASLSAEALLADPHDTDHLDALHHAAEEHFRLAREGGYKPVDTLVSPRILAVWNGEASTKP